MCAWQQALRMTVVTGALWACAPNESPFKSSNLIRVVPGGRSVSVVNAKTENEARPWAMEYCNKQGLVAVQGDGYALRSTSAEYDCL